MTIQTKPIDLYYLGTPNGRKVTIMLEELLADGDAERRWAGLQNAPAQS